MWIILSAMVIHLSGTRMAHTIMLLRRKTTIRKINGINYHKQTFLFVALQKRKSYWVLCMCFRHMWHTQHKRHCLIFEKNYHTVNQPSCRMLTQLGHWAMTIKHNMCDMKAEIWYKELVCGFDDWCFTSLETRWIYKVLNKVYPFFSDYPWIGSNQVFGENGLL
jgi:hypothetical protein